MHFKAYHTSTKGTVLLDSTKEPASAGEIQPFSNRENQPNYGQEVNTAVQEGMQ